MKDKISVASIKKAAEKDMLQLSGLNFMLCIITAVFPALPWLVHELFYRSTPCYAMVLGIIGFIASATLQAKALLDIVHNRKQNLFADPLALIQAFLLQMTIVGLWYAWLSDFNPLVYYVSNDITRRVGVLLLLSLVFIVMRLQFTSLYILEQKCNILQAIQRSWLLTKHNNWLFDRFVLLQLFFVCLCSNLDFAIVLVAMNVIFATPVQVRIFKELE